MTNHDCFFCYWTPRLVLAVAICMVALAVVSVLVAQ